ncbi:recombinase family protein [Chryseobacterium polytrichastri]|uniref:recombinase family protein n=1 Tax=Chryseobacterium polytrichastri TaxID=1302687 RepID=UPI000933EA80
MQIADLYIRVSTDEQAEKGYSQRDQLERLEKYCNQNQITIGQVIFEDHSAKNFTRPEWIKYINYIKKRSVKSNIVLFTKWDRFSRNAGDAYQMIKLLQNNNISPQAIEQPLDMSIPENKMMLAIYLAAPEVENDRRALNTFYGMRRAQKEGRIMGTASYGYINKCTEEGRKYVALKEPEASNMRWAFNELSKGIHAANQIRLKMNTMGGSEISSTSFYRSIRNPIYCGKVYIKAYKDENDCIVAGKHEGIISEAIFNKVQCVLNNKKKNERPKGKIISIEQLPLRGFLKCPKCSSNISGSGSKGKKNIYYYYHCNSKCGYRYSSDVVNKAFESELKKFEYNEGASKLLREIILANFKHIQHSVDIKKKEISTQIGQLNDRLNSAREKYLEDRLDYEDYEIIKNDSKQKVDNLEMELQNQKLTRKNIDIRQKLDGALKSLPNLSKLYETGDIETKRLILCSIFTEKLEFQEIAFRTPKLNSAAALILLINNKLKNKKEGESNKKNAFSLWVTSEGFEPPTLRAEI